jgi:hypothetical protein
MSLMKDYVQYHNVRERGEVSPSRFPYEIDAKRGIPKDIDDHNAWLIRGEGEKRTMFYLHYCFIIEGFEIKDRNVLFGNDGHTFTPSVPLNDLPWFRRYKETAFYSRGLHPAPDFVAAELTNLCRLR